MAVTGVGGGDDRLWPVCARGGGDGNIAVDIVLQRFKMKGEKKKENLSS